MIFLKLLLVSAGSILLVGGVVGGFLRTAQLRELALVLGAESAPDIYLRFLDFQYRTGCFFVGWTGMVFLIASQTPHHHRLVQTCGAGLIAWGVFSAILGTRIAMPKLLWQSMLIVLAALGTTILLANRRVQRRHRGSETNRNLDDSSEQP